MSKAIVENINKRLYTSLNINKWKNTASAIDYFKRTEEKKFCINLSCSV